MIRRSAFALALCALPLSACSSGGHSDTSTTVGTTTSARATSSASTAPSRNLDTNGHTIGPPAAPVTYTTPVDSPSLQSNNVAPAGSVTFASAPKPADVVTSNPDSVASAFVATVNTFSGNDDSLADASQRATYLATGSEEDELQADGEANANVDPSLWSWAQSSNAHATVYLNKASTSAANTATTQNRCFSVTRSWVGAGSTKTEPPFEECVILSKSDNSWLVSSDTILPSGD